MTHKQISTFSAIVFFAAVFAAINEEFFRFAITFGLGVGLASLMSLETTGRQVKEKFDDLQKNLEWWRQDWEKHSLEQRAEE